MSLQFISDSKGETTGVFIPINEWNELKTKFEGIEDVNLTSVPDWHIDIVRNRMDEYKRHPEQALDFDTAMDDIEKEF